jgi:hypothetical protein
MNRKLLAALVVAVALFAGAYLGSPYWAAHNFREAARNADADKLDAAVDFPAVRESLKAQLSAAMMKKMGSDPAMKDNPFAGLGALMMPAIIDKMVDSFVTPDGIAAIARGQKPRRSEQPKVQNPDIEFAGAYVGMDRFRVKTSNRKMREEGPALLFERRGLFGWKLIRLELPDSVFDTPASTTG